MDIYLMRHGEAEKQLKTGDDSKRPLTAEGVARMQRQAATLARWKLPIDLIISSPFTRARQTADAVAEALHLAVVEDDLVAGLRFNIQALGQLIQKHRSAEHLLLTGHEPDFSSMLAELIGGGHFRFEKGGLARVHLETTDPPNGTLIWFLAPETMGA